MFPYVTAYSGAGWNSPKCGQCMQLTDQASGNTIFVTVIDQCGPPPDGSAAHFDIARPAFDQLFGQQGENDGHGSVNWQVVDSSNCQGNLGNGGGSSSNNNNRCGADWADANSRCGTPCVDNDGPCNGQTCFASLDTTPCNSAMADEVTESFGVADNVVDQAWGGGVGDRPPQHDGAISDEVADNWNGGVGDRPPQHGGAISDEVADNWGGGVGDRPPQHDGAISDEVDANVVDQDDWEVRVSRAPRNGAISDEIVDNVVDQAWNGGVGDPRVNEAVAATDSTAQASTTQPSVAPAFVVAMIVIGSIVLVLSIVVIIQLILLSRSQAAARV